MKSTADGIMKLAAAAAAAVMAVSLSGCSGSADSADSGSSNAVQAAKDNGGAALSASLSEEDIAIAAEDKDAGYEESDSTIIKLSGTDAEISGSGAAVSDGALTISDAGTYILSGSFNGQIFVKSKGSDIRLVLSGVTVSNSSHSALLIDKASKVTLTLNEGTVNSFSDGASYTQTDSEDNADAAIFSRADLTINGGGTLNVTGNYKHGIVCKDELVITGGEINADSVSTGINGKDCVKISGGEITVSSGTNGITSNNDEDASKGFVAISGGRIVVNSAGDGIQAETTLHIDGGDLDITTGGGSENASIKSDGTPNGDWGSWGRGEVGMDGFGKGHGGMRPDDGGMPGEGMQSGGGPMFENVAAVTYTADISYTETSSSAKALKSGTAVEISGGNINIDSSDDSVHSNGSIIVTDGAVTASSGDDGMHSDGELVIEGGTIAIKKSYEGIEGANITVSGGCISVTATDDGFNAAGGSDTGSSDRMGRDGFNTQNGEGHRLTISGGSIYVNANGDGLDSNGDLYITGGTVFVDGPVNGGNGAIDYGDFGCTARITGGTVIAVGAVGMEVGFDESSTQYSVLHNFGDHVSAGSEFTVTDSSGNVIFSYTPSKIYQSVVFSSPDLSEGAYTFSAGGLEEQIDISSIVTSNSSGMGSGFGGRRGGDFGGEADGNFGGGMGEAPGGMQPPDGGFGGRGFR